MKTVLIVEDNKEIRDEICDIFKMEKFKVLEAANGLEGFITASNEIPDIIISDILMPIFDGYKMYEELKNNELTDGIPIIFLSALATNEDVRKGMNLGADDYLTKPVIPDDLINATENKLNKYAKIEEKYECLKTDISTVLHHELRTPLNCLVGFSEYLKDKADDLSKDQIKDLAENLHNCSTNLMGLVQKYLLYSDLKMKQSDNEEIKNLRKCEFIETFDVINQVISEKIPKDRSNDLNLKTNIIKFKIEEEYFRKLFEELIDNAVKFSSVGDKITVTSEANNDSYILKVRNEGRGMKSEQIKRIDDFKKFTKKNSVQEGSGLGLTIVKLITELFGGKFEVESIPMRFISINLTFKSGFKVF